MKNNILISVILALVVALGVVVIGSDEAVAQNAASSVEGVPVPSLRSTLSSLSSYCVEGYVFVFYRAGNSNGGASVVQVFEARLGNNSVPMKCE